MRRALAFVAGLAAVLTVVAGSAGAAPPKVRIAQVDSSRYPLITAVVIAPGSNKLSSAILAGLFNEQANVCWIAAGRYPLLGQGAWGDGTRD